MEKFFQQNVICVEEIPQFIKALSNISGQEVLRQDMPKSGVSGATLLIKLCDMVEYRRKPRPDEDELNSNREKRHSAVAKLVELMHKDEHLTKRDVTRYLNTKRPKSGNNRTALHHATFFGMHDTVEFLLGEGLDARSVTRNPRGDWGGRTFLEIALLQKYDDWAIEMIRLLQDEWAASDEIEWLLKNRDASNHGYRFAFWYAFVNECDKTFKWIVDQIFEFEEVECDKQKSSAVKQSLKMKLPELGTNLIEEFLGLWSVAIRAIAALPKKCVWNTVGNRKEKAHLCKANDMVEYTKHKLEKYNSDFS